MLRTLAQVLTSVSGAALMAGPAEAESVGGCPSRGKMDADLPGGPRSRSRGRGKSFPGRQCRRLHMHHAQDQLSGGYFDDRDNTVRRHQRRETPARLRGASRQVATPGHSVSGSPHRPAHGRHAGRSRDQPATAWPLLGDDVCVQIARPRRRGRAQVEVWPRPTGRSTVEFPGAV